MTTPAQAQIDAEANILVKTLTALFDSPDLLHGSARTYENLRFMACSIRNYEFSFEAMDKALDELIVQTVLNKFESQHGKPYYESASYAGKHPNATHRS